MDANDWRRQGQARYLMGVTLQWTTYTPPSPSWDHDHCEFCHRKFSAQPEDLHEGYTTPDQYRWVCARCFEDFRDEFGWAATIHAPRE